MKSPIIVLFLIFMTLKLCDVIAWSWWWVTAPLWGAAVLWLLIFLVACAFYVVRK